MKLFRSKTRTEQGSRRSIAQLNDQELEQLLTILPEAIESGIKAADEAIGPQLKQGELK